MNHYKGIIKASVLVFILFSVSCMSTKINAIWKNPKIESTYSHIFVAAMTHNQVAKNLVETNLATSLADKGVKVTEASSVFVPTLNQDQSENKDEMLAEIKKQGCDGILTVALVNKETETRYVSSTMGYAPAMRYGYYGGFSGYYTNMYPMMYSPGYYQEDKIYFIETNLYDAQTEELVWSAQSKTYNPENLQSSSREFGALIVQSMENYKVIE